MNTLPKIDLSSHGDIANEMISDLQDLQVSPTTIERIVKRSTDPFYQSPEELSAIERILIYYAKLRPISSTIIDTSEDFSKSTASSSLKQSTRMTEEAPQSVPQFLTQSDPVFSFPSTTPLKSDSSAFGSISKIVKEQAASILEDSVLTQESVQPEEESKEDGGQMVIENDSPRYQKRRRVIKGISDYDLKNYAVIIRKRVDDYESSFLIALESPQVLIFGTDGEYNISLECNKFLRSTQESIQEKLNLLGRIDRSQPYFPGPTMQESILFHLLNDGMMFVNEICILKTFMKRDLGNDKDLINLHSQEETPGMFK
jgi:hypothetical protein